MRYEKLTATIYDYGDPIDVFGNYYPGCKGERGDYGEPMTPDDDPDIEFEEATDGDGKEVELTEDQRSEAIQALWESLSEL